VLDCFEMEVLAPVKSALFMPGAVRTTQPPEQLMKGS
jgi:hypothetical protein